MADRITDEWGNFIAIPNLLFQNGLLAKIGVDSFTLFSYLRYRTNSETKDAYPSYETMVAEIGITKSRIAKALRVLEQSGLLERRYVFGGVTHYILKRPSNSPTGGLLPTAPIVQHMDSNSPTGGLPIVRQVDCIKTESIKTEVNKTEEHTRLRACDPGSQTRRTDAQVKGDALDGMLFFGRKQKERGVQDLADWPEDVRAIVQEFCRLWNIDAPPIQKSGKGKPTGEYFMWLTGARDLRLALAEFGLNALEAVREEWVRAGEFTVVRPSSIASLARATVGKLRQSKKVEEEKHLKPIEQERAERKLWREKYQPMRRAEEERVKAENGGMITSHQMVEILDKYDRLFKQEIQALYG